MAWAPDYTSSSKLAKYLRIEDTVDDVELGLAVTAASRAVDRATNRQFGLVAAVEERSYTARWDRRRQRFIIDIDDLMTSTGLIVDTDDGVIDVYALEPTNAAQKGRPWESIVVDPESAVKPPLTENGVTGTARWGWSAIPGTIAQATLLQASRFATRRQAPFGVAGSPDQGSEMRLLAKVDADVEVMVASYRRWWAAK